MDFFSVMFVFVYVVIGFGFARVMEKVTDTQFGKDCQNNFMTMLFWPFILVMIAFNRELVHAKPPAPPEDSYHTL